MLDRELRALRRRLDKITRGRGRRYPVAVRERVQAWVGKRLAGGARWEELSRELDIAAATLQHWMTLHSAAEVALRPVDVIEAIASSTAPAARTLTIMAPSGLRVEGVTVADAIAILRGMA
jgi:transposase